MNHFYPRPPRGGRLVLFNKRLRKKQISIHALREEGDLLLLLCSQSATLDFYPRPPRGGRPINQLRQAFQIQFLSTPSARRATFVLHGADVVQFISIHALREEGDPICF